MPFELVFEPTCGDMIGDYSYELRYYWGGLDYPSDKYISFAASFFVEPSDLECEQQALVNANSGSFTLNSLFSGLDL